MNQLRAIAVAGLLAATFLPAAAAEISGAGATFPYPVYAKWADTYKKETGVGLNYQSIGSGGGIKQIEAKTDSVLGYGLILANQPGAKSWPMTAATFILMPKQPPDPVAAAEALKFFAWAYEKGDTMAEELDYVPMPNKVVSEIEKVWAREIKDAGGKPLYVPSVTAQ